MTENQKLREALQSIAWSNDSKWQADCARQALTLPTAPTDAPPKWHSGDSALVFGAEIRGQR